LIKDYNKDGGGKYAEYYTPHAVSKIMAKILVDKPVANVTVYDPSAGSGTLLMNVANEIGEKNCTIFSQDISQKSSGMLRLNLILNDLVHSIPNVIQGNTLLEPAHRDKNGLKKFDYIVSNPPFKLDFSDFRDDLAEPQNSERFFAGIPKTLAKQKDKMAIYLLFLQHIITSLSAKGKSAIVVPNGFLTAGDSIERKIKELLISSNILTGVIAMPASIFANTTTKVSILFLDKNKKDDKVVFIDASNLGTLVKEGKNKRNVLSSVEEEKIIDTFVKQLSEEKFSEIVESKQVFKNSYSLNPGLYFKLTKKDYQIDPAEFENLKNETIKTIEHLFKDNAALQKSILSGLNGMRIKNEQ
jgi:type I restriction enzyme M protein